MVKHPSQCKEGHCQLYGRYNGFCTIHRKKRNTNGAYGPNYSGKLSREQVESIRSLRREGWKLFALAEKFKVCEAHISRLCSDIKVANKRRSYEEIQQWKERNKNNLSA